jgi:hypothetical protein
VIDSPGGWQPAPAPLQLCHRPSWATDPGEWVAVVSSMSVVLTRDGAEVERHEIDLSPAAQQVPLRLFEERPAHAEDMDSQPGDTVTIDATIRFGRRDLHAWEPFIDRYGQCVYADFPEKVHSDAELAADVAAEDAIIDTMPASTHFDEYGGYLHAGWTGEATGFFRVVKRNDYWWLISPAGNPCFYIGMSTFPATTWPSTPVTEREFLFDWLPPREAPWSAAWGANPWGVDPLEETVAFHTCNLIRKYGADDWWMEAEQAGLRRLDSWGFSGGGKWGAPHSIVSTPVLYAPNTPVLAGHPDFFDEAVRAQFRQELAAQIEPRANDPNILGWSFQSEYDALVTGNEIKEILTKPAANPSKRAILDYAVDGIYAGSVSDLASAWGISAADRDALYATSPVPPDGDTESLRRWYEEQFCEFVHTTIKDIDPDHLYIAPWIVPWWWEDEEDWRIQARHCDVMGYDRYAMSYHDAAMDALRVEIDVPTFCGEFSFPPTYGFERGYGLYHSSWADDEADAGERYCDWVKAAAEDPSCVGLNWFHYRDQPLTGRGPGRGAELVYGEHYAFGVVTMTDRPKWPLVQRMREANLGAAQWRVRAVTGRPFLDVPTDHWAVDEIAACVEAGLVAGYPDNRYRPDLPVSRDQMAVYTSRAVAGGNDAIPDGPSTATFPDVPADHWAYKHVEYAADANIVTGYDDGTYRPDVVVTRDQMAVFVARSMVAPTGDAEIADYTPPGTPTFSDVDAGSWAYAHIEYLVEHGVVAGYADGTYRPAADVTRDQMAVYIARAFGLCE